MTFVLIGVGIVCVSFVVVAALMIGMIGMIGDTHHDQR